MLNNFLKHLNIYIHRYNELVNQQLDRLSNAGYAVFWIGHTKNKTKEDVLSNVTYDIITNNLEDNFFSAIEARSQMVMNFVAEREFENRCGHRIADDVLAL